MHIVFRLGLTAWTVFRWGWNTFCFPDHLVPWNTLLQSGLLHFASQLTFLLNTLSSAHFSPYSTLCSQEHFFPQHTLLHETLCFLESKVSCREHFTKVQNVPGSKMFQGAECSRKRNVPGSKVFQEEKCSRDSRDQNMLRSKMFLGAKCESAKCATEQSVLWSKVCVSLDDFSKIRNLISL